QDFRRNGGGGQRQRKGRRDGAVDVKSHPPAEQRQYNGGDPELRRAEAEYVAPHVEQARQLKLKTDAKQQQDDAEFGELQRACGTVKDVEGRRPKQKAGRQIADNGAEAEPVEQRRRNDGRGQENDEFYR